MGVIERTEKQREKKSYEGIAKDIQERMRNKAVPIRMWQQKQGFRSVSLFRVQVDCELIKEY